MKTIWFLFIIAIAIIVKGDGDGNINNSSSGKPEKPEHAKADDVSQVTDTKATVQSTSTPKSTGPRVSEQSEIFPTASSKGSKEGEGNGSGVTNKFTPLETTETTSKPASHSSATTPNSNVDSVTTSATSLASVPTTTPTTSLTTTTTQSSSSKKPNCCCCCCENCAEGAVTPTKDGGIVANGTKDGNISEKGINKSRVIVIVITVGFLAVVTFVSCCYKRRGDISMKVRTWSIRARQFDFNSLRPVCLRWKKPNCESSPILVFKVDETELDVLTDNMV